MQLREGVENPQIPVTPQAVATENEIETRDIETRDEIEARTSEPAQTWRDTTEPATESPVSRRAEPEQAWRNSTDPSARPAGDIESQKSDLQPAALFPDNELHDFRGRWDKVQGSFVDEPRQAVEQADSLVATVVQRITEQFADERARLEQQWGQGKNVSTEDLRVALRRYRSLFDRLLSF